MDPIEKLLSELNPTQPGDGLDRAMTQLFDRADSRARRRRFARNALALAAMLALGTAIGYRAGQSSVDPAPVEFTYVLPSTPAVEPAFFDRSNYAEPLLSSPVRLTVEVRPASGGDTADWGRGS